MPPVPYRYRVDRRPPPCREPWRLSVVMPNGMTERMATYASLNKAVSTARLLAGRVDGRVEVLA